MTGYPRQYRENRARILAGQPLCAICGRRKATTVDHIIEADRGGSHDMDNLRPACKPCNSARGARYVNAKNKAIREKAQARTKAVDDAEESRSVFFGGEPSTPRDVRKSLSPTRTNPRQSKRKLRTVSVPDGHDFDRPRLETPTRGGRSLGPDVAEWAAAHLGIDLMPWQVNVLTGLLETVPGSPVEAMHLAHRYGLVSVARQNGKTTALKALVGWWVTSAHKLRGGPQVILTTAHALDLATQLFNELAPVLEERFGATVRKSYGRNELTVFGNQWLVRAATPSVGHGRSPDLIVADEVWDISELAADQGLLPSQRARRYPLFSMWSTAGTEGSTLMQRWRQQGLRAIDEGRPGPLYFAGFEPPSGADPGDESTWAYANPALGHTLELDTLRVESQSPNRAAFLRGSLNLWVAADNGWLQPGLWDSLRVPDGPPPATVLAIDSAPDESRYVGVLAGSLPDGRVHVRVAFITVTEADAWAAVRECIEPGTVLAVTPTLEIHTPLEIRKRTTVGYGELLKWTTLVRAMIAEGRLVHGGDVALADHMNRAVAVKTMSGVVIASQRSPGPIELARCTVWAAALASKARWTTKATIGGTRRAAG